MGGDNEAEWASSSTVVELLERKSNTSHYRLEVLGSAVSFTAGSAAVQ